jgi:uncharacterized protein (UPF0332 family)
MKRSAEPAAYMRKAERTLAAARTLLRDEDTEGACNRAYYAMFNATHAALRAAGIAEPEGGYKSHGGLIGAFVTLAAHSMRCSVSGKLPTISATRRRLKMRHGRLNRPRFLLPRCGHEYEPGAPR